MAGQRPREDKLELDRRRTTELSSTRAAGPTAELPAHSAEAVPGPAGPAPGLTAPAGRRAVSRRGILRLGFWTSLGGMIAGTAAGGLRLIYPPKVGGFGGKVTLRPNDMPTPGKKIVVPEGRFWLANLTAEQGGPGLLALWWKCPHLGCTVPWNEKFIWPDPTTGADKEGWFRCPCHGSTYTDAGIRVYGPAPRSMDTMALVVDQGRVIVDTGKITLGAPDNPRRAARV